MKLDYDAGGFLSNLWTWLLSVIVGIAFIFGGFLLIATEVAFLSIILFIIGGFAIIIAFIYPAVAFWTLDGDNIEELKNYNKDKDEKEHIKIPHPKRAMIATLTIIGFFTGGIGHLIALFIGCGQGLVEISESQRKLLSLAEGVNSQEQKSSITIGGVDVATVTSTGNATTDPPLPAQDKQNTVELEDSLKNLRELKSLLDDGVIDQETYDKKKKEIGF